MLEYCLDITANSYAHIYTPDSTALSFPFYLYEDGYFEANTNYYTKRSELQIYLLIYTLSGSGIAKVNGKVCNLNSGSAVLIDCRDLHEYWTTSSAPWCFHYLHLDGASMDIFSKLLLSDFNAYQICDKLRFMQQISEIHDIHNQTNLILNNIHSSNLISGILTALFESYYFEKDRSYVDSDAIGTACDYMEKNLDKKISIEKISSMVNLSKYYFIRLFQHKKGITPYLYVQLLRINRAKELLISTDRAIKDIAQAVGFSSTARFSKCFLDLTGTTPTQYRKNSYLYFKG